jgi:hypothetical protein
MKNACNGGFKIQLQAFFLVLLRCLLLHQFMGYCALFGFDF